MHILIFLALFVHLIAFSCRQYRFVLLRFTGLFIINLYCHIYLAIFTFFVNLLKCPIVNHWNIMYSQTCLKGSPKRRTKSGCLRQVNP